ncbi:MAG: AbrB/MazE/SpoVT family DNA-binding domain-containing protein [Candidatus Omnitrophica bacterium]|nr:AbrB/MazE/SpoVT family DNA-binding domain-containing protein [Candidatus Omnitrophota bacterium]MBI3020817.1 AbrB/MazE/SpoVT family DNA-binding domain-containing protein [Candidatus Omnitrophota bacterium]MBI3083585.1 AbrB/MazE/SpoVT family DNA-binding domain-containing protein [Candidatus Omnitrophota bacterium]
MTVVRTLGKGQVVIPKAVRDGLGIKVGTPLVLRVEQRRIVLEPVSGDPVKALRGMLKDTGPSTADLLRSRREERERESREAA